MAVISLDIQERTPYVGGRVFGQTGAYEVISGVAHYAFDPNDPANTVITDIGLAPRNRQGLVECQGDFRLFRPVDPVRGKRALLVDVVNRGNSVALNAFNESGRGSQGQPDPGNGFLFRHGFAVLQCGWQFDVAPGQGPRLHVPDALAANGAPLTGRISYIFQPIKDQTGEELFAGIYMRSLPMDADAQDAVLTVRDYEDDAPTVIPRGRWRFAREAEGKVTPDTAFIYKASGFAAGKIYEVVYTTSGAHIAGVGLLATRDMVSFLKYGTAAQGNPCAGELNYAHGFGVSQTGRFLRLFVYLGLNLDERGRQVLDGVLAHIGGGRMAEFNKRFPQLNTSSKRTLSYLFPYTDVSQRDPVSGRTDSILAKSRLHRDARGGTPKIFFTNSAAEYYGSLGSLIHTNVESTEDVAPSDAVRIYQISGAQHGSGALPLNNGRGGGRLQQYLNIMSERPVLRAALLNLHAWVAQGQAPPPSKHPRIADGTLVAPSRVAPTFNRIPGVVYPERLHALSPRDYQAGFDLARANHTGGGEPMPVGIGFTTLVAAVDQDGNELGGVRLPDVTVPLAAYTGWNVRHKDIGGENQMIGLSGSTIPFPVTRAQRQAKGDPRKSIEERYASRDAYLAQTLQAALELVRLRYMLEEDVEQAVALAGQRWDALTALAENKAAETARAGVR